MSSVGRTYVSIVDGSCGSESQGYPYDFETNSPNDNENRQ